MATLTASSEGTSDAHADKKRRVESSSTPSTPGTDAADNTGFPRDPENPRKRMSPSCARNKGPILAVLTKHLPDIPLYNDATKESRARVLEIASGSGEHVAHFAAALPCAEWQPTEWCGHASPNHEKQEVSDIMDSIAAWTEGLQNVQPPLALDASAEKWPDEVENAETVGKYAAIVASNVAHIAPLRVVHGIFNGASRLLTSGGRLFLYGPFAKAGQELSEGNAKFNEKLTGLHASWGLREVEQVASIAAERGMDLVAEEDMPANNKTLVFIKRLSPN